MYSFLLAVGLPRKRSDAAAAGGAGATQRVPTRVSPQLQQHAVHALVLAVEKSCAYRVAREAKEKVQSSRVQ